MKDLSELTSLLSEGEKAELKAKQEKRDRQAAEATVRIEKLGTPLTKKIVSEKEFNRMFDFLKQSKERWYSGTDKDGDYIVHDKYKYYR